VRALGYLSLSRVREMICDTAHTRAASRDARATARPSQGPGPGARAPAVWTGLLSAVASGDRDADSRHERHAVSQNTKEI